MEKKENVIMKLRSYRGGNQFEGLMKGEGYATSRRFILNGAYAIGYDSVTVDNIIENDEIMYLNCKKNGVIMMEAIVLKLGDEEADFSYADSKYEDRINKAVNDLF